MNSHPGASQFPPIFVDERDYEKLSELAAAAAHSMPDVADSLLTELERATVVGSGAMPPDIVRLGSRVTYKSDNVARRQITLVLPGDADISAGKVSILTPIGTALLGLRKGQSILWSARNGRPQHLCVIAVEPATSEEVQAT